MSLGLILIVVGVMDLVAALVMRAAGRAALQRQGLGAYEEDLRAAPGGIGQEVVGENERQRAARKLLRGYELPRRILLATSALALIAGSVLLLLGRSR